VRRKPWELAFTADPEEIAGIRRVMRLHLSIWGLHGIVDDAQLCMSEMVTNVVTHVGEGTPVTLAVSIAGTHLRIEVHDPDPRALPTLVDAVEESESGRGMALIDALASRWGVSLCSDRKITWCELPTGLQHPRDHVRGPAVIRAEALLGHYVDTSVCPQSGWGRATHAVAEEAAIGMITDLLHWFRAHGQDADEILDRAQTHFDTELSARAGAPARP
jgi:anti-sigma regulatory factor (Ser/Thr protein kinase)